MVIDINKQLKVGDEFYKTIKDAVEFHYKIIEVLNKNERLYYKSILIGKRIIRGPDTWIRVGITNRFYHKDMAASTEYRTKHKLQWREW